MIIKWITVMSFQTLKKRRKRERKEGRMERRVEKVREGEGKYDSFRTVLNKYVLFTLLNFKQ